MSEETELLEKPLEINLKKLKLKKVFKKYKIPLFFGALGLILIATGSFFLFYSPKNKNEVEIIPAEEQKSSKEIMIDVAGAVFKPGVYKLKDGDRLQDALVLAGGLSEEADREWVERNLNLAVRLVDGNKVYIPKISEANQAEAALLRQGSGEAKENSTTGQVAGVESKKININTASTAQLDTLYGVGEKTAQKIISGRPYSKIEDLVEKKIVYQSAFDKIKEKISIY